MLVMLLFALIDADDSILIYFGILKSTALTKFIKYTDVFVFCVSGANVNNVKAKDAGLLLGDTLTELLSRWRAFVPDGLHEVGYRQSHLDALVKGTLPQRKVIDVSPRQPQPDDLKMLLEQSMKLF